MLGTSNTFCSATKGCVSARRSTGCGSRASIHRIGPSPALLLSIYIWKTELSLVLKEGGSEERIQGGNTRERLIAPQPPEAGSETGEVNGCLQPCSLRGTVSSGLLNTAEPFIFFTRYEHWWVEMGYKNINGSSEKGYQSHGAGGEAGGTPVLKGNKSSQPATGPVATTNSPTIQQKGNSWEAQVVLVSPSTSAS